MNICPHFCPLIFLILDPDIPVCLLSCHYLHFLVEITDWRHCNQHRAEVVLNVAPTQDRGDSHCWEHLLFWSSHRNASNPFCSGHIRRQRLGLCREQGWVGSTLPSQLGGHRCFLLFSLQNGNLVLIPAEWQQNPGESHVPLSIRNELHPWDGLSCMGQRQEEASAALDLLSILSAVPVSMEQWGDHP